MGLREETSARRATTAVAALLWMVLGVSGCAGAGAHGAPIETTAFHGVRTAALVRRIEHPRSRAKDALDGVQESLTARGVATTVVDVPPRPPRELARLAALDDRIAQRIAAEYEPVRLRAAPRREPGAAEAVAALGVDAAVFHVRPGVRHRSLSPHDPFGPTGPSALESRDPRAAQGSLPTAIEALAVASRDGAVAFIAWDPFDDQPVTGQAANAFEAIDELLRLLGLAPPQTPDELDDPRR
jgi:hypothetical protein